MITSWEGIPTWSDVREGVFAAASESRLLPFFGAALSMFEPTSLPLGPGLLRAALQGVFSPPNGPYELFCTEIEEENRSKEEDLSSKVKQAVDRRSAEVVLQGLAEGLLNRDRLASFYNQMEDIAPNPLHFLIMDALQQKCIPAVFTTNQDRCLENAAIAANIEFELAYDEDGFAAGLRPALFQFHGIVGGQTTNEKQSRRESLAFTLNSMGPRLPGTKLRVMEAALEKHTLLFLGYSGSDPDIWYTLHDWLSHHRDTLIYWCVWEDPTRSPSGHLYRLQDDFPDSIKVYRGDIGETLVEMGKLWGLHAISDMAISEQQQRERLGLLRDWTSSLPDLKMDERKLAFGWLLVSVELYDSAAEYLEDFIVSLSPSGADYQRLYSLASLFAGFAYREMSRHRQARRHLGTVLTLDKSFDDCRRAQAVHKMGESLSAFESTRFWYWFPEHPAIHGGARYLNKAIRMYELLPQKDLAAQQLSRTGKGNALMNLGQLYRRVAAFLPGFRRSGLEQKARELVSQSIASLELEGDMRALAMAIAALGADEDRLATDEKLAELQRSIEMSEQWNQDEIQIGSAYFAKAQFLTHAMKGPGNMENIEESERCYCKALAAFRKANMKAEVVRTELDLVGLLALQARSAMRDTEGSWEWEFGMRVLGVMKVLRALLFKEVLAVILLWLVVLAIVDSRLLRSLLASVLITSAIVLAYVVLQSLRRKV